MLSIVLSMFVASAAEFPATEVALTEAREIVAVSHANSSETPSDLVYIDVEGRSKLERHRAYGEGKIVRHGPIAWGMVENALYTLDHSELIQRHRLGISTCLLIDRLEYDRSRVPHSPPDPAPLMRMEEYHNAGRGSDARPLDRVLDDIEGEEGTPLDDANLYYDLTYTDREDITLIAVREGKLHHWTRTRPENEDWVDEGVIDTEIDGAFRIMRADRTIYLIDRDGDIYSSPDAGHERVGRFVGWENPVEEGTMLLIEDHKNQKIGAVMIADGLVLPLLFAGDPDAATDFITEITDTDVVDALRQVADVLNEGSGGGNGE